MLTINISELVLTIASFFLLLLVLDRLLLRPLLRFMEDRQARIDAGLKAGTDAEAALEQARSRSESALAETKKQADRTVIQAGLSDQSSLAATAKLLSQENEAAGQTAQAEARVLREQNADRLKAMAPQLAELLADRMLGR